MKININKWKSIKTWKSITINEIQWQSMKLNENEWKSTSMIEN